MDEGTYQTIIRDIEKYHEKYELKEERLVKIRLNKELKVLKRNEIEPILSLAHEHPLSGHFGLEATLNKLKERYYWPKMKDDIKSYIQTCDQCQKHGKTIDKNELHSIKIKEPFYQGGIDIVGPLTETSQGNKYIVVAIDYFTKYPEARVLTNVNAKSVANFIYEDIICRHGCPRKIISDRRIHFNNQVIEKLLERFKIRHNLSTPYHPKTNGLVERFNKTLCESLAKLNEARENWDEYILLTLFAYRIKINKSIQFIPFHLTYGREAILPFDEDNKAEITLEERVEEISTKITQIKKKALENIEKSQSNQKRYHNRKIKRKSNLNIGDKVLLYDAAKAKQWSGKLEEKWKGPYFIHDKLLNGSYKLKDFKENIFKILVNGEILKRYHDRQNYVPYITI